MPIGVAPGLGALDNDLNMQPAGDGKTAPKKASCQILRHEIEVCRARQVRSRPAGGTNCIGQPGQPRGTMNKW